MIFFKKHTTENSFFQTKKNMKPITFCIATAKNEKEYIKLLINSLQDNTQINLHEILVFIDSDNQNTYEFLLELKTTLPNLKIYKNPSEYPIGSQRNISIMFNAAINDIVCYLQSDMVVGKHFDKYLNESMTSDDILVCGTRIEPPIHPLSSDKYTYDFGLNPSSFDYNQFNKFVSELHKLETKYTNDYSVPFAIHKKVWLQTLGGYDTQFRCSHEDIDSVIRMNLAGILIKQNWKAIVYHFTCVSSRGIDWFENNKMSNYKKEIQQLASNQEGNRFLRKWHTFNRNTNYRYNVGLSLTADKYINIEFLKQIEPYFDIIQIKNDDYAITQFISQLKFDSNYYSNIRWGYTPEHWENVKHLFNETDFDKKITKNEINSDTLVICNYSDIIDNPEKTYEFIQSLNSIIHENDIGEYEFDYFKIKIYKKHNFILDLIKVSNLKNLLDSEIIFV